MASYEWELGIDWGAVEVSGRSYLQQGFVERPEGGDPKMVLPLGLQPGDTITFRIFDVSETPRTVEVRSLEIISRSAVIGQQDGHPFDTDRPAFGACSSLQESVAFQGTFPCWESAAVSIVASAPPGQLWKFLLTFSIDAAFAPSISDIASRAFVVDPEMSVGEHGEIPVAALGQC
jgi:hypothetical protein